jgi:hypothetical protein
MATLRSAFGNNDVWNTVERRAAEEQAKGSQISPQELSGYSQQLGMSVDPSQLYNMSVAPRTPQVGGGMVAGINTLGTSSRGVTKPGEAGSDQKSQQDFNTMVEDQRAKKQSIYDETVGSLDSDWQAAYAPIVGGIDERLGALPGRRGEELSAIDRGVESYGSAVETGKQSSLENLSEEEGRLGSRNESTLRKIAQQGIQGMQSANQYLGARGAGDSSVAGKVGEFITRGVMREKGEANKQLEEQIGQINSQRRQVEALATQKMAEYRAQAENMKQQAIARYQEIEDNLRAQQDQASSQEKIQILQARQGLQEQLQQAMDSYDGMLLERQSAIEDWNRNRAAELEDAAQRIAEAGTYTGFGEFSSGQNRLIEQARVEITNRVANDEDVESARRAVSASYGIPLEMTPYPKAFGQEQEEIDPIDQMVTDIVSRYK